jgi:Fe/S biogenesis protein NfuA
VAKKIFKGINMIRSDIQKIIDEEINPALEMHGGYISIHDFDEKQRYLKLKMGGGCHGCASSKMTMMSGVERHFREIFPDIGEIEDVTDHSTGENPYYVVGALQQIKEK